MNENIIPATNEVSVITSISESSFRNDIIDLTEINDGDECEVTSNCSAVDSNNSANPQQPKIKPARNRRRKNSNSSEDSPSSKARSGSADDSICILYEKIQPPPDIEVVNEIIFYDRGNGSANNDLLPFEIPPILMGTCNEGPDIELQQISQLFPEISSERASRSTQLINNSFDAARRAFQQAPHHSFLPSCKYATAHQTFPPTSLAAPCPVTLQTIPRPTTKVQFHSKSLPVNLPSQGSDVEESNIEVEVPKIQCGICLDGPDEIAASNRNFTSTNCGHIFCNICIQTSLKTAAKCPKCRKRVTSKQFHPLYL